MTQFEPMNRTGWLTFEELEQLYPHTDPLEEYRRELAIQTTQDQ